MSTTLQSANTAALGPYLRNFALAYLGIAVLTATLVWFLNITNSAMGVVSVMAAASLPAQQFVKNNQRLMMTSERLRFAVYATFLSILVTALLFGAAILVFAGWDNMPALFEQFIATVGGDASLGFLALGIACLISFAVIYFAVGFFGKQSLKALQK